MQEYRSIIGPNIDIFIISLRSYPDPLSIKRGMSCDVIWKEESCTLLQVAFG